MELSLALLTFAGLLTAAGLWAWLLVRRGAILRAAGLFSHLAVAARRGAPLADELDGLGDTLLRGDRDRVHLAAAAARSGEPPHAALRAGRLVPPDSEPVLAAGAATGTLGRAFADEAARLTGRSGVAGGAAGNALFYVLVTLTTVQAVLGYLMYEIVPKYKKIWEEFGLVDEYADPWFESLMTGGNVWVRYFYLPFLVFQLAWLALPFYAVVRQKGYRLPGVRFLRRRFGRARAHASRLLRTLAAAAEAGRPFSETLDAYAAAADSRGPALRKAAAAAGEGGDVWAALERAGVLKFGEVRLARASTAAGNLPAALRVLADRADAVAVRRRDRWFALVQPAATLLTGVLVAWIALAFFSPVVTVINGIGGY